MPARSQLEFLDLPPELRLMIYCHLLVCLKQLAFMKCSDPVRPSAAITRTSRLVYREAFMVLYRENQFRHPSEYCDFSLGSVSTYQSIHIHFNMDEEDEAAVEEFEEVMHDLGDLSIIRDNLIVQVYLDDGHGSDDGYDSTDSLEWLAQILGQSTHFNTIELHLEPFWIGRDHFVRAFEYSNPLWRPHSVRAGL